MLEFNVSGAATQKLRLPSSVLVFGIYKAAFTPGQHVARQQVVGNMCPVAINMFLVSATKLLPVCCPSDAGYKGIQVDRDINE